MKIEEFKQLKLTLSESECFKLNLLVEKGVSQIDGKAAGQATKEFGEKLVEELERLLA